MMTKNENDSQTTENRVPTVVEQQESSIAVDDNPNTTSVGIL